MTSLNSCPAWCADKYPADDPRHSHDGPLMAVRIGRAKSEIARLDLPSVLVFAFLPDFPVSAQPFVTVLATRGTAGTVRVRHRDADGFAAIIDVLAGATPAQHREVAAAIRQAAALIEGGASADG